MSGVPATFSQVSCAEHINQAMEFTLPDKHHHVEKQLVLQSPDPDQAQLCHACPCDLGYPSNFLKPLSDFYPTEALRKPNAKNQGGSLPCGQHSAWSSRRGFSHLPLTYNLLEAHSPTVPIQFFLISSKEEVNGAAVWNEHPAIHGPVL